MLAKQRRMIEVFIMKEGRMKVCRIVEDNGRMCKSWEERKFKILST
jgi:hypothetical protein